MMYKEEAGGDEVALYSTFEHVNALESHYHHWPESEKQEWRKVQQFMYSHLKEVGLLEMNETEADVMHLVSKIESNGFGLALEEKENKKRSLSVTLGRILFPLASLLNHDCNSNCEVEQRTDQNIFDEQVAATQVESLDIPKNEDQTENNNNNGHKKSKNKNKKQTAKMIKDIQSRQQLPTYPPVFSQPRGVFRVMMIRALRDIQSGSALTISYIDSALPVASRRQRLLEDYYFNCFCDRCKIELKL
ncbi:hypothetical protein K501DRAFT_288966 [Backusella circina FSU 941]|nr:hypothetical protein K501DRAFT_288966 [Backusella circina FSU 941]